MKFANLIPKKPIKIQTNKLGKYANRSAKNISTSLIPICIMEKRKNIKNT
jgi:hypothetical protein